MYKLDKQYLHKQSGKTVVYRGEVAFMARFQVLDSLEVFDMPLDKAEDAIKELAKVAPPV